MTNDNEARVERVRNEFSAQQRAQQRTAGNPHTRVTIPDAQWDEACGNHGPTPEAKGPVRDLRIAISDIAQAGKETFATVQRINADPTRNAAQQYLSIADAVEKRIESQRVLIDVRREQGRARLNEAQSEVNRTLQPTSSVMAARAPEIRAHLLSLSDRARTALIESAMRSKYADDFMHAVASAPPWLSGVHAAKHDEICAWVLGLRRPDLLGLTEALEAGLDRLDKAEAGFRRLMGTLVDSDRAAALRSLAGS